MRPPRLFLAAVAILMACTDTPTEVADLEPSFDMSENAHGRVVASASGSGHALCTADGVYCYSEEGDRALRTFSFTAQLYEDGTASGESQFNNRGRDLAWDADVECIYIRPDQPNQAWIAGTLTRGHGQAATPSGIPYATGVRVLFAVQDNGEGSTATAPDRITGLGTIPEIQYLTVCNYPQLLPPAQLDYFMQVLGFDPIRGDIQVRPPSAD